MKKLLLLSFFILSFITIPAQNADCIVNIAGKSNGFISTEELIASKKLMVAGCDSCKITSFEMSFTLKDILYVESSNSSSLTSVMIKLIKNIPAGTKITFENASCLFQDGLKQQIKGITLTKK